MPRIIESERLDLRSVIRVTEQLSFKLESILVTRAFNYSAGSGEVIRRSYGVWHTECFSNPVTTEEESSNLCKTMGYVSGTVKNDVTITEEPRVLERDDFYVVKMHNWFWMTLRNDKPLITLVKHNGTCHRAFISCV